MRAKAAFPAWRAVAPGDRALLPPRIAAALEARHEQLAWIEVRKVGKSIANARGEIGVVIKTFRRNAVRPSGCSAAPFRSRAAST